MDPLLALFKQKPRDNWRWTLDPNQKGWSRDNALALANCALLAYSDDREICKQLKQRQFQTVIPCHSNHRPTDTQAYVALRPDAVVIAFRGTEPTRAGDFMTDFDARQIPFETKLRFSGWGQVHEGWSDGANAVLMKIAEALKASDDGARSLWITGHSLGGALAMVAAAFLANVCQHQIAGVFTYGQPRVGDPGFRARYDRVLGNITFRCVNDRDLVPHVPPRFLSRVERALVTGELTGIGNLFGSLVQSQETVDHYEHAGQLRLLLPDGKVSQNPADEAAREPAILAEPRTARSLSLDLPGLLIASPALLKDHAPINPLAHDGYIERIEGIS